MELTVCPLNIYKLQMRYAVQKYLSFLNNFGAEQCQ
jgi:hypothetical protein